MKTIKTTKIISTYTVCSSTVAYLSRHLSKVVYERDGSIPLDRVLYLVHIHCALVKEMVEHVVCFQRLLSVLFVAKDEVNPLVEMSCHIVTLQGLCEDTEGKCATTRRS